MVFASEIKVLVPPNTECSPSSLLVMMLDSSSVHTFPDALTGLVRMRYLISTLNVEHSKTLREQLIQN